MGKIILGVDPGIADTGYGLVLSQGSNLKSLAHGSIKTPAKDKMPDRLNLLYIELNKIIKKHKPDLAIVESLFFNKNVKTALIVGQARGVILLALKENNLPIFEISPSELKLAVSSYGRASKSQMQKMVKLLLNLKEIPKPDDAADALALAIAGSRYQNKDKLFK